MVREKLGEEITALDSADAALAWAIRRIEIKNNLTAGDVAIVEKAFQDRIRVLAPDTYVILPTESATATETATPQRQSTPSDAPSPPADAKALGSRIFESEEAQWRRESPRTPCPT